MSLFVAIQYEMNLPLSTRDEFIFVAKTDSPTAHRKLPIFNVCAMFPNSCHCGDMAPMVTSHMAIILVVFSTKSLVDSTSLRYVHENVDSVFRLKACTRKQK